MTQDPNAKAFFTVNSGETVTVTVDSVKTNCLTAGAFDENALPKSSSNPDVYQFTVADASGDQPVFACVCTFAAADSADSHYTVAVSSDGGGDVFTIPDVYKDQPPVSFALSFQIN